ncbi:tetratricopeptide repeat protein [Lignipirellula cremea]|uniref:Tetratricopeptide repeat protein n=1 Tax=Lignipirellula cremea TaxID=2528010 RepID=A0A518DUU8_9BACT|nr:hypothetical protein [Lignipirellula cremea]QDU95611.1 Tetratricopeptide repeat protein [Lignipirellula cremea]
MTKSDSSQQGPLGVINAAQRRRLQLCFEQSQRFPPGQEPGKRDFDAAHTSLLICVTEDPGNQLYVEAFLKNLQRKYKNNKTGALIPRLRGRSAFRRAVAQQDHAQVLAQGPMLLGSNPWNVPVLRAMAQACAAFALDEVELCYLRQALDTRPHDPAVNDQTGQALARQGRFKEALSCFETILVQLPGQAEATAWIEMLRNGQPRPSGDQGLPENPAAGDEAGDLPRLRQTLADSPAEMANYLQLAERLLEEDQHDEAEQVLSTALAACGSQLRVLEMLEDVRLAQAAWRLEVAEQQAALFPSPAASELVERFRGDWSRAELVILDARAQRYPQTTEYKWRLGQRLHQAGNHAEAIRRLEEAASDPEFAPQALLTMAECFACMRKLKKASACYQQAADAPSSTPAQRRQGLHGAILLAERAENGNEAAQLREKLQGIESCDKDRSPRLDKTDEKRHKK